MSYEVIYESGIVRLELRGKVGVLYIVNGKQNKIAKPDFIDIRTLDNLINETNIKALIISGEGRNFSVGADIDNIKNGADEIVLFEESLRKGKQLLSYIERLPIITVATVNGICFGAGLEIALSCQFRIGSESTVIAFPEANLGIMPGLAGTIRLPKLIGRSKAIEIIVSGRTVNSDEALQLGILDKVVPKKQLLDESIKFIERVTENKSMTQVKNIITSINNATMENDENSMNDEGKMFVSLVENMMRKVGD